MYQFVILTGQERNSHWTP